ncbi:TPA: hypothetical protein N0F65_009908 [Lagenidium giganteum]|uniref:Uncharacterized protein n=1 Tax=Lagenidium giganteum TaxID=4803 RepID=A0AAV2YJS0_9STRA|nr:TPA: hypothetical protein N0F65_009908 [Lagenidium giganteum]
MTLPMPGTPPLPSDDDCQSTKERLYNSAKDLAYSSAEETTESVGSADEWCDRHLQGDSDYLDAAGRIQRTWRCHLARQELMKRQSTVGRPVELGVATVKNLQMLCDYRCVRSAYCHVRVLKKPFGPFMFEYTTKVASNMKQPRWEDRFLIPVLSSKCDVVVTFIGITVNDQHRFLGQAVFKLGTGWENQQVWSADLGKLHFPVGTNLQNTGRYVQGTVEVHLAPVFTSTASSMAGQFMIPRPPKAAPTWFMPRWTQKAKAVAALATSYAWAAPASDPLDEQATFAGRKDEFTRWGVLTETHLHLYEPLTAAPWKSLELAKLQLVQQDDAAPCSRDFAPASHYPVKIYYQGELVHLQVSSRAQQVAWHFKINLLRRRLLVYLTRLTEMDVFVSLETGRGRCRAAVDMGVAGVTMPPSKVVDAAQVQALLQAVQMLAVDPLVAVTPSVDAAYWDALYVATQDDNSTENVKNVLAEVGIYVAGMASTAEQIVGMLRTLLTHKAFEGVGALGVVRFAFRGLKVTKRWNVLEVASHELIDAVFDKCVRAALPVQIVAMQFYMEILVGYQHKADLYVQKLPQIVQLVHHVAEYAKSEVEDGVVKDLVVQNLVTACYAMAHCHRAYEEQAQQVRRALEDAFGAAVTPPTAKARDAALRECAWILPATEMTKFLAPIEGKWVLDEISSEQHHPASSVQTNAGSVLLKTEANCLAVDVSGEVQGSSTQNSISLDGYFHKEMKPGATWQLDGHWSQVLSTTTQPTVAMAPQSVAWSCPACTLNNEPDASKCATCGTAAPSSSVPAATRNGAAQSNPAPFVATFSPDLSFMHIRWTRGEQQGVWLAKNLSEIDKFAISTEFERLSPTERQGKLTAKAYSPLSRFENVLVLQKPLSLFSNEEFAVQVWIQPVAGGPSRQTILANAECELYMLESGAIVWDIFDGLYTLKTQALPHGSFSHVTIQATRDHFQLLVDEMVVEESMRSVANESSSGFRVGPFTIGGRSTAPSGPVSSSTTIESCFAGVILDLRVWTRVIVPPSKTSTSLSSSLHGSEQQLLAYLPLVGDSERVLLDMTANENHATVFGAINGNLQSFAPNASLVALPVNNVFTRSLGSFCTSGVFSGQPNGLGVHVHEVGAALWCSNALDIASGFESSVWIEPVVPARTCEVVFALTQSSYWKMSPLQVEASMMDRSSETGLSEDNSLFVKCAFVADDSVFTRCNISVVVWRNKRPNVISRACRIACSSVMVRIKQVQPAQTLCIELGDGVVCFECAINLQSALDLKLSQREDTIDSIADIFGGQQATVLACKECGKKSVNREYFWELLLNMIDLKYTPITDITAVSGSSTDIATPAGFERINNDLNKDRSSAPYVFLCVKRCPEQCSASQNPAYAPITDLIIRTVPFTDPKPTMSGYERVEMDLNSGGSTVVIGGKKQVYLFFKRDPDGSPITDLQVIVGNENVPDGFKQIRIDLNQGEGSKVFLCYRCDMPITDLKIVNNGIPGYKLVDHLLNLSHEDAIKQYMALKVGGTEQCVTDLKLVEGASVPEFVREGWELTGSPSSTSYMEHDGPPSQLMVRRGHGNPIYVVDVFRAPREVPKYKDYEVIDIYPGSTSVNTSTSTLGEVAQFLKGDWVGNEEIDRARKSVRISTIKEPLRDAILIKGSFDDGGELIGVAFSVHSAWSQAVTAGDESTSRRRILQLQGFWRSSKIKQPQLVNIEIRQSHLEDGMYSFSGVLGDGRSNPVTVNATQKSARVRTKWPISSLYVIRGDERVPDGVEVVRETVSGRTGNLLAQTQSPYSLYLAVKREENPVDDAYLTDVCVIYGEIDAVPEDYVCVQTTPGGFSANLNDGTSGVPIFICYHRGKSKTEKSLIDLALAWSSGAQADATVPQGFTKVLHTPLGMDANLNQGTRGVAIHLCFAKCDPAHIARPLSDGLNGEYEVSAVGNSSPANSPSIFRFLTMSVMEKLEGARVIEGRFGTVLHAHLPGSLRGVLFRSAQKNSTSIIGLWSSEEQVAGTDAMDFASSMFPFEFTVGNNSDLDGWWSGPQPSQPSAAVTTTATLVGGPWKLVKDSYVRVAFKRDYGTEWKNGKLLSSERVWRHDIATMLSRFVAKRTLGGDNVLSCSDCQRKTESRAHTVIVSPPKFLILTIKRMYYDWVQQKTCKCLHDVQFPAHLVLPSLDADDEGVLYTEQEEDRKKRDRKRHYGLYGALVHSGMTANSGHYYSFCRESSDIVHQLHLEESTQAPWIKFNDSKVELSSWKEMNQQVSNSMSDSVYLLLYKKLSYDPPEVTAQGIESDIDMASSGHEDEEAMLLAKAMALSMSAASQSKQTSTENAAAEEKATSACEDMNVARPADLRILKQVEQWNADFMETVLSQSSSALHATDLHTLMALRHGLVVAPLSASKASL